MGSNDLEGMELSLHYNREPRIYTSHVLIVIEPLCLPSNDIIGEQLCLPGIDTDVIGKPLSLTLTMCLGSELQVSDLHRACILFCLFVFSSESFFPDLNPEEIL